METWINPWPMGIWNSICNFLKKGDFLTAASHMAREKFSTILGKSDKSCVKSSLLFGDWCFGHRVWLPEAGKGQGASSYPAEEFGRATWRGVVADAEEIFRDVGTARWHFVAEPRHFSTFLPWAPSFLGSLGSGRSGSRNRYYPPLLQQIEILPSTPPTSTFDWTKGLHKFGDHAINIHSKWDAYRPCLVKRLRGPLGIWRDSMVWRFWHFLSICNFPRPEIFSVCPSDKSKPLLKIFLIISNFGSRGR